MYEIAGLIITLGPFELTKISAQVSVLMADSKKNSPSDLPGSRAETAKSYQNKGTLKTAQNIVRHRGMLGLYSGFNLHLCMSPFHCPDHAAHV